MAKLTPLAITPQPGVVLTETGRIAEGRWIASDNIRFVQLRPQKIGGWAQAYADPTDGVPRAMHAWRDNSTNPYLAAGTYKKLYVYDRDLTQNDITPFRATGTLGTDPFTVTAGCDKRFETCRDRFANSINFRGFPHIPGNDFVISGADASANNDGGSLIS